MKNTVAYIKSAYIEKGLQERKSNPLMYLIYRPLSFYLTPLFLSFSLSANAITLIGLIFSLCLPIIAIFGGKFAFIYVSIVAFFCLIFDCIDGNIARVTKKSGFLGQYLDSLAGRIFWVMLYLAVGILVQKGADIIVFINSNGIFIGLSAAILDILGRGTRDYVKLTFPDLSVVYFSENTHFFSAVKSIILGFGKLIPILLILFSYFNLTYILLIGIVINSILIFCYSQTRIILNLHSNNR